VDNQGKVVKIYRYAVTVTAGLPGSQVLFYEDAISLRAVEVACGKFNKLISFYFLSEARKSSYAYRRTPEYNNDLT
jgi:hypothetical protein